MIKLTRDRSEQAIVGPFRGATPRKRLVKLMKEARGQLAAGKTPDQIKIEIESKWAETKEQLLAETHHKCAYCETSMLAVAFGDVEHYRPKSRYWWFAYVYDNYLASCAICNQRFKSDQFEFSGAALPPPAVLATSSDQELEALAQTAIPDPLDDDAVRAYEAAHRSERPLIPNPYIDDPEVIFAWEVREGSREVEVVPRPGVEGAPEIVAACQRIYGLNRPDLMRRRFQQFEIYQVNRLALRDLPADAPSRPIVQAFVQSLATEPSQYAAMIRFLEAEAATG